MGLEPGVNLICGEVDFLLKYGYRKKHEIEIRKGLEIALNEYTDDDWYRLGHFTLRTVFDELYEKGLEYFRSRSDVRKPSSV